MRILEAGTVEGLIFIVKSFVGSLDVLEEYANT